jgi:hypothetical protein
MNIVGQPGLTRNPHWECPFVRQIEGFLKPIKISREWCRKTNPTFTISIQGLKCPYLFMEKMSNDTMIEAFHSGRFIHLSYVNVIIGADIIKADVSMR